MRLDPDTYPDAKSVTELRDRYFDRVLYLIFEDFLWRSWVAARFSGKDRDAYEVYPKVPVGVHATLIDRTAQE